jgi:ABC-type amino acid transport substrate-binding protein
MDDMRAPVRRFVPCAAASAALILLAACGEEPTPPRLTGFVPASPAVTAGGTIDIRVAYEANDFELDAFEWTAEAGEIEGNGKPAISYRAPDAAGSYKLTVATTAVQDGLPDLSLSTTVEVQPALEPAVSETSPAAEAPAAEAGAGQRAAEAARAALQGAASQAVDAGEEVAKEAQTGVEEATEDVAQATGGPGPQGGAQRSAGEQPAPSSSERGAPGGVEAIVERGRLVAAVESDFAPFSFEEDGRRVGFDVDMMHEFARRWVGDPDAVTFLPVASDQRIAALQEGKVDLVAAALTRTPEREEVIDFSETYFKDGQRILVAEAADVAGPCDLAGKKVAALAGTTSLDNVKAEAAACGFDIESDLVVLERSDQAVAALLAGEVDAFTSDGIALERLADGQPLKVVGNHFSEESYGFGIPQGDERLRRLVDLTLQEMDKDGTYAAIYQKWFDDDLSPYPLQADPSLARDEQLAALATTDLPPLFEPVGAKAPAGAEYVVQSGDTLSTIAGKLYGDVAPGAWRAIWEANRATIGDDPNRIRVGMQLTLPSSL